ncbi:MAG: divalent metal cation transporter [Alphaproteobacteria bacterium]|nr:divalent metal cation transporter [Alphaproteobacteria bacterium]
MQQAKKKTFWGFGPGALVTAAFIGPGTITACTLAGVGFGYALLWALVFATFATVILQEMSARLGVVTQKGLGETLAHLFEQSIWKWPLFILVAVALYLGNAAYEAGNLSGAALGIEAVFGEGRRVFITGVVTISALASILLLSGSYKLIERMLIVLVLAMALAFVTTFFLVMPDLKGILRGLFIPYIPSGSLMTVIALIGTTVVPYNLFLHASAARRKWSTPDDLGAARQDNMVSIGLGGLVAIFVVSTAAGSMFAAGLQVTSAGDMARQLEPLFGKYAVFLLGTGIFAAGLTSAITAPLATAFAMTELLDLKGGQKSTAFRTVALSVVLIGAGLSLTGIKPIKIILAAQFANGLLLPIIAGVLLFVMNQRAMLGQYANGWKANILGIGVLLIVLGLGVRSILRAAGWI